MKSTPAKRSSHVVQHFDTVFAHAEIERTPSIAKRPWVVVQAELDPVRPVYAAKSRENMERLAALLSGERDLPGEMQKHRWRRVRTRTRPCVFACTACRTERGIFSWTSRWGRREVPAAFVFYWKDGWVDSDSEPPCTPPATTRPKSRRAR